MRYLVVGLGNIGNKRCRILGQRCVATVDPLVTEATFVRHEDVALDAFDAVILAIPNHLKLECLEYFLRAGKQVLVEKPLIFPNEKVATEFSRLARDCGAIWYTSYTLRFEPHLVRLRELLCGGAVGEIYHARLMYGNGTVGNWIGTWRESGSGVLEDLGCHLIDLCSFLFPASAGEYLLWDLRRLESQAFDYGVVATADRKVKLEFGTVVWRNTFEIDVFGRAGSLHMAGLAKWGATELVLRRRTYPSGAPVETRDILKQPDASWEADLAEFERRVRQRETSWEADWHVSSAIHSLICQASTFARQPVESPSWG